MSNEQRNTIWRFAIIFIVILIGFVAVIGRIIYVQTVERDQWLKVAEKQEPTRQSIPATRGNILDCEGRLLATSMPRYLMLMDMNVEALRADNGNLFYTYIDSLSYDLANIAQFKTQEEYRKTLIEGFRKKRGRVELNGKKTIDYFQRQAFAQNPLIKKGRFISGIFYEERYERIYPYGNLARRSIGNIYADGGVGNAGLEKRYETELRGENGLSDVQKIGGRKEAITVLEAKDGMDIVTTIDMNLQDIVEKALIEKTQEKQALWGCCILMETQTGYIRAIANVDRTSTGEYTEQINHAVRRVEPGSTFKTISLAAMMNDGLLSIDDTVSTCAREWYYLNSKKSTHTDTHPKDTVYTVQGALAVSSNIAFAKLVTREYKGSVTRFIQSLERLGIKDSMYCEIPGYEKPVIRHPNDTVTIAKMSYGYAVEISPMTLAMFYNAIANDGRMVRPMLVTDIMQDGQCIKHFDTQTIRKSILSKKNLEDIRKALYDVVWDNKLGTASVRKWEGRIVAYKAQSQIVPIAGKTGTAQIYNPATKKHDRNRHRMTFVGYFPADNPQYTCVCMIEDPKGDYDAGMHCGYTVRKIAEKVMAYTGCYVYEDGEKRLEKR